MGENTDHVRIEDWAAVLDDSTYYELLGLLEIADDQAIKTAFHQFALAFHPDQHIGANEQTLATIRRLFQRGAEAYRVLSNPELRQRYDMAVAKGQLRLDAGEVPNAPTVPTGVKSLDELCKTAAAQLCARKADKLISEGDLAGAKRELQMAIHHDGGDNPELAERLDGVDIALFAMGE